MKPDTPDTPYILAYTIDEVDDDCREGQRYFINILISSQTLMDTILHDPSAKCLMIDTTHGLSVDKLLLCLVGTCNKYQEFICLSLTTNENTRSATQCLKWVKERHQGAVTAVMADGAMCLSNAIEVVFGKDEPKPTRLMCISHMFR